MAQQFDKFLIAPFKSGLQTDLKPWLIPEDAFERLDNAYVFRGRVRKRFGGSYSCSSTSSGNTEQLVSRLRIPLSGGAGVGTTDGAGAASGTAPGAIFKAGQLFSIGTEIFTVPETGTPVTMLTTGSATTCTFNTTTGAYVFDGATAGTQIYFYPAEPVMGLSQYESGDIHNLPSIAFDTQFAYKCTGTSWEHIGPTASQFHGDSSNFFWTANFNGSNMDDVVLFVTNFQASVGAPGGSDDSMWYYDGSTWTAFAPKYLVAGAGNKVVSARIIIPFKDRLLLLNTIESDAAGTTNSAFKNRCRFSQNGSPIAGAAFYEPNQAGYVGGGWIDAATEEEIISAEFIKDRLIVYFERSTWELAYTGNQVQPFVWQKINTELGSQSMKSTVPFDSAVLTIGARGIEACSGANVERIDSKIPDDVFQIRISDNGNDRVAGVRDFETEMVYWTFPTSDANPNSDIFPNKVLVYNYENNSWGFNDDCITAFGYYEQYSGETWQKKVKTWEEETDTWESGLIQPNAKVVIAGNQQGFVFIVDANESSNPPVMQISKTTFTAATGTTAIVIRDHTLQDGDFIRIENATGTSLDGIYKVEVSDSDTVVVVGGAAGDAYLGGGTAARVSRIDILSKQWNPYIREGRNAYLGRIDFIVNKTDAGEITVDYYPSSSQLSMIDSGNATGALMGTNVLETYAYPDDTMEAILRRLTHRMYFQGEGTSVQIRMYLTDDQMTDSDISESDFQLQGMMLYTSRTGDIV